MKTLPSPPPKLGGLSNAEFDRLKRTQPDLWASPDSARCVTCRGKGSFRTRQGDEIVDYQCNCPEQWLMHLNLLNAGIGISYQQMTWADVDGQVKAEVQEKILDYSENAERYIHAGFGAILLGPNGTGKTLLSTLLLKSLIADGYDCFFTQFNEMLESHTKGWRDAEEQEWFVHRVRNVGVLVVDDIGKEARGRENITTPMFDQVIRSRCDNNRPTIITTNYSIEEIQSGYGVSAMSLLSGTSEFIEVTGADFRPKQRLRKKDDLMEGLVRPVSFG